MNHIPITNRHKDLVELTIIGSAFAATGAALNTYIPAFHKPVAWVDTLLYRGEAKLCNTSVGKALLKNNPLVSNQKIHEYLAVNVVETALVAGVIVAGGGILKLAGLKKSHMDDLLKSSPSFYTR